MLSPRVLVLKSPVIVGECKLDRESYIGKTGSILNRVCCVIQGLAYFSISRIDDHKTRAAYRLCVPSKTVKTNRMVIHFFLQMDTRMDLDD